MNLQQALEKAFRAGQAHATGSYSCFRQTHPDCNEACASILEELKKDSHEICTYESHFAPCTVHFAEHVKDEPNALIVPMV